LRGCAECTAACIQINPIIHSATCSTFYFAASLLNIYFVLLTVQIFGQNASCDRSANDCNILYKSDAGLASLFLVESMEFILLLFLVDLLFFRLELLLGNVFGHSVFLVVLNLLESFPQLFGLVVQIVFEVHLVIFHKLVIFIHLTSVELRRVYVVFE